MADEEPTQLDEFAAMADEESFKAITPQLPPKDPRIKELLSRALLTPDTLSPEDVRTMAASLVYHLLAQGRS